MIAEAPLSCHVEQNLSLMSSVSVIRFEWRVRPRIAFLAEIIFITTLILVTRCANYGGVFFGGQINFIDADCYARMRRARICFVYPGTIISRHDVENFPSGSSPHSTAVF